MTRVCFDIDMLLFEACSVAEEKFVTATHRPTGKVMEFENRTELWGEWRKKVGGWVGLQNAMSGNDYYKAEDFDVVDGQRPRPFRTTFIDEEGNGVPGTLSPFDGAKKILDDKIATICHKLGATSYFGYTGKGEVFRHEVATLLPYKGNRDGTLAPLLLGRMKEYVCEKHNCEMVTGMEADDACSIAAVEGYKKWKKSGDDVDIVIQSSGDKDAKQTTGWYFNPDKSTEAILIEGFGSLWLDAKGKVDGCGRMWLYFQIASGDDADNYAAACHSDKKYGPKSAYADLKDCKNDKEAFTALVAIFKKLYPEKKTVTTFRGDIEIDAMYVFQELATLAMMLRHVGDSIDVRATCDKLSVIY